MEVAHAHGILHQDVKPANILLDADGSAMLTDFGIAAPMSGQGSRFGGAGSPGYMAPERLNEEPSGPASDLWSLGASLYTAVEGRGPFERELPAAVAAAVLLHEPPFPARAGRDLGRLLMAMLAKDPAVRPSAAQVRQALSGLSRGAAASHGDRRAARPRRWLLPLVLAAVAALGGGGWYAATALGGLGQETGRFAKAPDPCALLTSAQAAQLTKGTPERTLTRPGECQWLVRRETGRPTASSYAPGPSFPPPTSAGPRWPSAASAARGAPAPRPRAPRGPTTPAESGTSPDWGRRRSSRTASVSP
ncbi:protein kinase [Nonomuraea antimicrobica]